MTSKQRVAILGAAVAVAAFGIGGATCYAQEPGVNVNLQPPVQLNANLDVNQLFDQVGNAVGQAKDRNGAIKAIMETAYNGCKQRYNVMVFNMNQNYNDSGLQGVQGFKSFQYNAGTFGGGNITYGCWIFDSGTFVNQGDGGYANWTFNGSFTRGGPNNQTVTFTSRNQGNQGSRAGYGNLTAPGKSNKFAGAGKQTGNLMSANGKKPNGQSKGQPNGHSKGRQQKGR